MDHKCRELLAAALLMDRNWDEFRLRGIVVAALLATASDDSQQPSDCSTLALQTTGHLPSSRNSIVSHSHEGKRCTHALYSAKASSDCREPV